MRATKLLALHICLFTNAASSLLVRLPQELLRHTIEIDSTTTLLGPHKKHEFLSPLLYLCLRERDGWFYIHFGFDQAKEFEHVTGPFIRMIYKLTMKDQTAINIEDCIITDSIITDTSGLIDLMQWKHPSLPVKVIKFKKGVSKVDHLQQTVPIELMRYPALMGAK